MSLIESEIDGYLRLGDNSCRRAIMGRGVKRWDYTVGDVASLSGLTELVVRRRARAGEFDISDISSVFGWLCGERESKIRSEYRERVAGFLESLE
jgi:hypothetical protein